MNNRDDACIFVCSSAKLKTTTEGAYYSIAFCLIYIHIIYSSIHDIIFNLKYCYTVPKMIILYLLLLQSCLMLRNVKGLLIIDIETLSLR